MRRELLLFTILMLLCTQLAFGQQYFNNVAQQLGITGITGLGHSVSWGDIDNDGDPDLGLGDQVGYGYWFFRNEFDYFPDITSFAGIYGMTANKTIIADFTGDNFNDLLIRNFNYAGEYCNLFKNNGDGIFSNVTYLSGLPNRGVYSTADFNNDGNLDVLSLDILDWGGIYLQYGNGDGTFTAEEEIGIVWGYSPLVVFDYDRDGFIDIFWPADAALYHPTTLLKNNGDGSFSDVTASSGIVVDFESATADVGDLNNDGFLDMYIGGSTTAGLFLNNGDGTFSDITVSSGATGIQENDRSVTFGDYNNDGWLDIFMTWHLTANYLYMNNGDNTYTEVAYSVGLGNGGGDADFFGTGWADYNNDGAIDIFAAGHFNPWVLYENQDCPGNALFVNLIGAESNSNGIGAQADMWIDGELISRNMLPDPGIQDFSNLRLHFGMGDATEADSLIVYWPSGIVRKFYNVPAQQHITITEYEIDPPTNVNAEVYDDENVLVTWNAPAGDVLNYNIYRDGTNIANTTDLTYNDLELDPGTYIYGVSAIFDEGESFIIYADAVTIENTVFNPPTNLTVDADTGLFTWDAPVSRDLAGYNIYLDSIFLEYLTTTEFQFEDLVYGQTYLAGVSAVYDESTSETIEIDFTYTGTEAGNDIVSNTSLIGNYPNPFNPSTLITYSMLQQEMVNISIYNIKGEKIKTIVNEIIPTGNHQILWNGTDDNERPVSSGIYLYKLKTGDFEQIRKMILLK